MKLNFLHCIQDSHFAESIIEEFKCVQDRINNYYVVSSLKKTTNKKFIGQYDFIDYVHPFMLNRYIKEKRINVIILHNILSIHSLNIIFIPKNVKVVWFAWGKDVYEIPRKLPFVHLNLYGPETLAYLKRHVGKQNLRLKIREYIECFLLYRAVQRVDYFSGVIPQEYKYIKQIKKVHAKEVFYHYSSLKKEIYQRNKKTDFNILINNSADPSGNHLDILEKLSHIELGNRTIYVPLSYGGDVDYINEIINRGRKLFRDNFVPITNYMPLDEYQKIIESCSFCIFGHERQQAMGNIRLGLNTGCKVFLSSSSITYEYFKKIGVNVFSIQDDLNEKSISEILSEEDSNNNARIFNVYRSPEVFYMDLLKTIDIIINDYKI